MRQLKSFLEGRWVSGDAPASTLTNAVTGEAIAETSTRGLDLGAALRYARTVGGPTLRAMSFAERGAALKAMGKVIHAHRDELIELAAENSGNTRGDAKFDVDGASGTLAYYGALGKRMGDAKWLLDGPSEPIGRAPRFVGQHLFVPRQGVAVHINAFNFPAWGMGEKLAVSLLAGVPALEKPATATAVVTARIVELWHEAGVLPEGSVSLLAGSAGDLLDHLDAQDVVAFTGSGDTGRMIKGHPRVLDLNIPVNVEADSLNAAILGPDVKKSSDTFAMFLNEVVRDLTQKAGQKCTAIRRILVPASSVEWVWEALVDRMGTHAMGDVNDRATTVSPLATAAQQRDILAGIAELEAAADASWTHPQELPDGKGFWVAPRLFRTDKGINAPFVHDHEVFGPVGTVVVYSGEASDAVAIVAKGGGGLVSSVYSDDRGFGGEVVLGLAPWHGRLQWGSKKVHDQGMGPGTVLPGFVHGGPGKAGGGEELGGERGLRFYWQRTAIQGDRALLEKVLGKVED
ncbi:MAG: 3,4-dehydroadipyl-CoA semialdehyde dehydrogenase [Deltaproteobacteria bacterium]|nr:MAG: 3,4-dehydroadipyl-CoA semialdehyde dehydrogenase [Deltaproteobacteria bacterium]